MRKLHITFYVIASCMHTQCSHAAYSTCEMHPYCVPMHTRCTNNTCSVPAPCLLAAHACSLLAGSSRCTLHACTPPSSRCPLIAPPLHRPPSAHPLLAGASRCALPLRCARVACSLLPRDLHIDCARDSFPLRILSGRHQTGKF